MMAFFPRQVSGACYKACYKACCVIYTENILLMFSHTKNHILSDSFLYVSSTYMFPELCPVIY